MPPKSGFEFQKGKPTWLLVTSGVSEDGKKMDAMFEELRVRMKGEVTFRKVEWTSKPGKAAVEEFTLSRAPASVIADSSGEVVGKFEGARDKEEITLMLKSLAKSE